MPSVEDSVWQLKLHLISAYLLIFVGRQVLEPALVMLSQNWAAANPSTLKVQDETNIKSVGNMSGLVPFMQSENTANPRGAWGLQPVTTFHWLGGCQMKAKYSRTWRKSLSPLLIFRTNRRNGWHEAAICSSQRTIIKILGIFFKGLNLGQGKVKGQNWLFSPKKDSFAKTDSFRLRDRTRDRRKLKLCQSASEGMTNVPCK